MSLTKTTKPDACDLYSLAKRHVVRLGDLAKRGGWTQDRFSKLIRGEIKPHADEIPRLAKVLKCPVSTVELAVQDGAK